MLRENHRNPALTHIRLVSLRFFSPRQSGIEMEYWPSARWKILMVEHGVEQWVEPSLPFALIGSHPCCAGHVAEGRVPPVAYFACCFADAVEVWPLSPIAYPRWGVTLPEHTLSVGKKRISLFHESHRLWPQIADRGAIPDRNTAGVGAAQGVKRKITLDWDGKPRSKLLARRVMIMGDDHPSTLRLHGQGLATCDHAVVCVGASVWLINLNPPEDETDPKRLCRRLSSMSDPLIVGKIKVRLGRAMQEKRRSQPALLVEGLHLAEERSVDAEAESAAAQGSVEAGPSSLALKESEFATPEALTSRLTDQLVRIDHDRFSRTRVIKLAVFAAGFLIALMIVIWIVFGLVIPMVVEMSGES